MHTQIDKQAVRRPIQILSPQLANQIAAGEVVERPASVVKELIENSLDADATDIAIDIEQGGQKRILIRDNGCGIAKEQLVLALSRHATSKISDIDDLEHISSMGFRGEALASISSVSRLTLASKPQSQSEAWQAKAEGREMDVVITPTAHPDGTSIDVKDLFFNTPARRKFLRTGKTEFQHIETVVKRIALARHDVQFILSHNGKVCLRYTKTQSLAKRVEQVCGKNILSNWIAVNYQYEDIRLTGWCSMLGEGESTRDKQYTFVNGRIMKDKLIAHAIRQVYEDTLPPQSFPAYVLYLELPPEQIDINVHPAKHELRFHHARQIHDLVFKAITESLGADTTSQSPDDGLGHHYIQNLESERHVIQGSADTYQSTQQLTSVRGPGPQRANISFAYPSKKEMQANHSFYQGEHYTPESPKKLVNSPKSEGKESTSFLIAKPYLIFASAEDSAFITIVHMQSLLSQVIQQRIVRSTISQALLMPVSTVLNTKFPTEIQNALKSINVEIQQNNRKLILKKVPSEIRHLPWASIFPSIDFTKLYMTELQSSFVDEIAHHWFRSLEFDADHVSAWANELDETNLRSLLRKEGKQLPLEAWMRDE